MIARQDYTTFTRLIDRPLRRWWARVGSLWVLLLVIVQVWHYFFATLVVKAYPSLARTTSPPGIVWNSVGEILYMVAWPGVLAVWLLGAQLANGHLTRLLKDTTIPDEAGLARYRFSLGMRQGWPVLLIFTLLKVVQLAIDTQLHLSRNFRSDISGHELTVYWDSYLLAPLAAILALYAAMTWLVALLAATHRRPLAPWLLLGGIYVLPLLARSLLPILVTPLTVVSGRYPPGTTPVTPTGVADFGPELPWVFFIGLIALAGAVWCFRNRLPGWGWPAVLVVFGGGLGGAMSFLTAVIPSLERFTNSLQIGYMLTWPVYYTPAWLILKQSERCAQVQLVLPDPYLIPTNAYLHFLSLLLYLVINVAWLILLYWFIHSVLLRPGKAPWPVTGE